MMTDPTERVQHVIKVKRRPTLTLLQPITSSDIDSFVHIATEHTDDRIILLKNRQVVQWMCNDLSFLPPLVTKNKTQDIKTQKILEDQWGQRVLASLRPDLKSHGQYTTVLGETLGKELHILLGHTEYRRPKKIQRYAPDGEINSWMVEVKTQTHCTTGTAGEKILGVPFKYADVPKLYGKPLRILCIAGAEHMCRTSYGILHGTKTSIQKQKMLDIWRRMGFVYVGATELLLQIKRAFTLSDPPLDLSLDTLSLSSADPSSDRSSSFQQ